MGTNISSRLDSGVPCVKFAIVTDSNTMDSKDVGAANLLNLLWRESICGTWINILPQSDECLRCF